MNIDTYKIGPDGLRVIKKDPNAKLDYPFNWTKYLAAISDTIASASVTADSAGISIDTVNIVGGQVIAWISGGTKGTTYRITCRITTSSIPPRIDERSFNIFCDDL